MFRLTNPASAFKSATTANNNQDDDDNTNTATCRQQVALSNKSRQDLARHHPTVKLPPRLLDELQSSNKQEQIQRCCDRFKSSSTAVDTLIRALQTILSNPSVAKYRRIDQINPGYQRSLALAPGAEQLLLALGFVSVGAQTLFLQHVNTNLLQMALYKLQKIAKTALEYQQDKKERVFAKGVVTQLNAAPSPDEHVQRQALLSIVPTEPSEGRSAVIIINFPGEKTLSRRFDGDDTLQDVLHWLGGTAGTVFLEKLIQTREYCLVDVNRLGQAPINCDDDDQQQQHLTLQHLGFWPSGRLQLRPSSTQWMERNTHNEESMGVMGASRGLASAPSETLS